MATILARLHPRGERHTPRWRVRCCACGRVYVLTTWAKAAGALRSCAGCAVPQRRANLRQYQGA